MGNARGGRCGGEDAEKEGEVKGRMVYMVGKVESRKAKGVLGRTSGRRMKGSSVVTEQNRRERKKDLREKTAGR